jgi:outer membrane protein
MNRCTQRSLVVAVSLAIFSWPLAAPARTLDRRAAVRAALAQNPQIAAARAEEAAVRAQARQVDAARWPMVSLDAGVGPSLKATLVPGTAAQSTEEAYRGLKTSDLSAVFLANLTIIQPLYTFGKIARRQEAAEHGLRAREAQTRMQRADVAFNVAQIYEGYLWARDTERFLGETIHWLDSTMQATEERLAQNVAGVAERDVLRLQAALGLAKMGLHQATAGKVEAAAGLVAFLGLPPEEEIVVAEPELLPIGRVPDDFASLVALASDKRPEFAALVQGALALDALTRAEAAGLAPDIFVMGLVSAAYTPGRDWLESRFLVDPLNHFVPGALLGLRWQFQGDMAAARAQEQQAHAEVLRHLGAWATAGIPAEVRRAYEDVKRARADIEVGNQTISKAKQWMVQASADYSVGFLDVREVSDAVEAYVTIRAAVMKAGYDHNIAMAALARATGTLDGDSTLFYLAPPETEAPRRDRDEATR